MEIKHSVGTTHTDSSISQLQARNHLLLSDGCLPPARSTNNTLQMQQMFPCSLQQLRTHLLWEVMWELPTVHYCHHKSLLSYLIMRQFSLVYPLIL
jgi:hypothetical protein